MGIVDSTENRKFKIRKHCRLFQRRDDVLFTERFSPLFSFTDPFSSFLREEGFSSIIFNILCNGVAFIWLYPIVDSLENGREN